MLVACKAGKGPTPSNRIWALRGVCSAASHMFTQKLTTNLSDTHTSDTHTRLLLTAEVGKRVAMSPCIAPPQAVPPQPSQTFHFLTKKEMNLRESS